MTSSFEYKKNSRHPLFVHLCLEIDSCLDIKPCFVLPPRGAIKTKPTAQIANFVLHASKEVQLRCICNFKHLFTLPLKVLSYEQICQFLLYVVWEIGKYKYAFLFNVLAGKL